jgi:hypothetical protein
MTQGMSVQMIGTRGLHSLIYARRHALTRIQPEDVPLT